MNKMFGSFYIAKKPIPYTLIVIDVQEGFSASHNENFLTNLIQELRKARENDAAILFVGMEGVGKHLECIWNEVYDYTYFVDIVKEVPDGSEEIIKSFDTYKFLNKNDLKICGVYSDLCVTSTTNGLSKCLPYTDIEILSKCCNTDTKFGMKNPFRNNPFGNIVERENVKIT